MITLYASALSTYCAKVRAVLRYKGVAFTELAPPDGYGSDAYRRIVPMGTIPGFVDGELVLSESEAIAEYLEERHPEPALIFGDAASRARIRSLSRIHDCWVEPQLRALYAHVRPGQRDQAAVERHAGAFHRRARELVDYARPAPYLAGDRFSLADCAWGTTLIQAELVLAALGVEQCLPDELSRLRRILQAHPALAPDLPGCRTAMAAWLEQAGAA